MADYCGGPSCCGPDAGWRADEKARRDRAYKDFPAPAPQPVEFSLTEDERKVLEDYRATKKQHDEWSRLFKKVNDLENELMETREALYALELEMETD